ncbi:MAG: zinc-binding alcohol dehydrogenase [Candidatus Hydrogenedentes bacterium]|nr:zinc-binding alcohol dehydrogenase [Candidatus Hydrogenedentota bacterium]
MKSTALICDDGQHFSLTDVILPDPGPGTMTVRTLYSGVSIGTEFALIRNKISWGPYPLCTGYQGVGLVEEAGAEVEGFRPGDTVYYRDNRSIALPGGAAVSAVSGTHCAHAVIDPNRTHGVALLPEGVPPDVGSMFVMPAVGLFGVDMANPRMGASVVVYGAGLIGLGVIAACVHRGCVVIAVDLDPARLTVAAKLGADHTINGAEQDVAQEVERLCPGGADTVFEATGLPACVDAAIALCRRNGVFVWQGNYGAAPVSMHFLPPHARHLKMLFPSDDGLAPCRRAVLKNIAMGALKWEHTITHRVPYAEAAEFFDRINKNQAKDVLGAVIQWAG